MSELVRTRQGDFELGENVLEYEDLSRGEDIWGPKVEGFLEAWNTQGEPSPGEEDGGNESGGGSLQKGAAVGSNVAQSDAG